MDRLARGAQHLLELMSFFDEVAEAIERYENTKVEMEAILTTCEISKSTLYRHIKLQETPLRT